ncbi:hypothetical protein LIER_02907 [Lithospermum erythrorhizon]|uniref:Uncharacterized protein n=1 Tax=Lithospermum erythrorhizon TaxID=34254 RepID=A0AAV3NRM4_LITER
MEKPTTTSKTRNKLVKLLQKAIKNLPRNNKKGGDGEGAAAKKSSESILPITKTAVDGGQMIKSSSFGEPISPKISCIGQIKHRKKLATNIHLFLHQEMCPAMASRNKGSMMKPTFFLPEAEKIPSNMRNTHKNNSCVTKQIPGKKSSCTLPDQGPCLDQMKRFPSFHGEELSEFDWKNVKIEANDYMNELKFNNSESEEEEDHVQELEPRKEINLWRRRTIDQPTPLHIRSPCTSITVHRFRC